LCIQFFPCFTGQSAFNFFPFYSKLLLAAMVTLTILAGGFSSFIATYIFNSEAATLTLTKNTTTGTNPSWIASHPKNKSIL